MAAAGENYQATGLPKVVENGGSYYVLNDNSVTNYCTEAYTMGDDDETKEITYTLASDIVYFAEGEGFGGNFTNGTTYSGGAYCNYFANPNSNSTVTFTSTGAYKLETNVIARESDSNIGVYPEDGTTPIAQIEKGGSTGERSCTFKVNSGTTLRIGGNYYNNKFQNSLSFDYIIIRKVADIIDADNEFVGAFDKTTVEDAATSADYTLKKGDTKVFTFKNHGSATASTNYGYNWRLLVKEGATFKAKVRADSYDDVTSAATKTSYRESKDGGSTTEPLNWTDFAADMADATVVATFAYGVDGTLAITTTSTGAANGYIYYVDQDVAGLTGDLTINLSVNHSWIEVLSVEQTAVGATIASSNYSSLATDKGLNFAGISGLTAYVVTNITKDAVTLTSVDEIPANQGVILKGTAGDTYSIPVKATAAAPATNKLQAAVTATDITANQAYILQGSLFHLVTAASTVPAGKAYLLASDVPANAPALNFIFADSETTGVGATLVNNGVVNNEIFNLSGQRVKTMTKGLYIVGGKKVVVK